MKLERYDTSQSIALNATSCGACWCKMVKAIFSRTTSIQHTRNDKMNTKNIRSFQFTLFVQIGNCKTYPTDIGRQKNQNMQ